MFDVFDIFLIDLVTENIHYLANMFSLRSGQENYSVSLTFVSWRWWHLIVNTWLYPVLCKFCSEDIRKRDM